jgi:tetrahydromethanopterin S-methyltransferase subunit C
VIPPIIWGADAVRRIASYGLGTGVPSIGNLATSMGVLTALVGFKFHPILGVAFAAIAGLIYGIIISRFRILEIPNFKRYIIELAVSSCLTLMCLTVIVAGGYSWQVGDYFTERLLPTIFATGFIIIAYWGTSVAVFHPFNASLGAGERQARTLRVAVILAGLNIVLAGIAMLGSLMMMSVATYLDALAVIIIGVVVWGYGLYDFLKVCMREAAVTTWTGIPPKPKR